MKNMRSFGVFVEKVGSNQRNVNEEDHDGLVAPVDMETEDVEVIIDKAMRTECNYLASIVSSAVNIKISWRYHDVNRDCSNSFT